MQIVSYQFEFLPMIRFNFDFTRSGDTWLTCDRACVLIAILLFPTPSIAISSGKLRFWICTCTMSFFFPSVTCLWARGPFLPCRPHSVDSEYVYCGKNLLLFERIKKKIAYMNFNGNKNTKKFTTCSFIGSMGCNKTTPNSQIKCWLSFGYFIHMKRGYIIVFLITTY